KLTVSDSDGIKYMFLAKPKDDLRKDTRLIDFNGIINKLLKTNWIGKRNRNVPKLHSPMQLRPRSWRSYVT
ncbi:hypothetical protein EDB19DRAFT_1632911, partial [Suillus lakei]